MCSDETRLSDIYEKKLSFFAYFFAVCWKKLQNFVSKENENALKRKQILLF